jgi:hypothetical protein
MIVTAGVNKYDLVLAGKYHLWELLKRRCVMEESLEEVAIRLNAHIVWPEDAKQPPPEILTGMAMVLKGTPTGKTEMATLLDGVLWTKESDRRQVKHIDLTIYDKTIYLAKSEEEYVFADGTTASDRLQTYAADWNIPIKSIAGTGVPLAKAIHRSQKIGRMIHADLCETAYKDGGLFRARMTPEGIELVELGSNETVWVLEPDRNLTEYRQKQTLEGTVTKVKVLGNAKKDARSPVLAMAEGETGRYGTIQDIIHKDKIKTAGEAEKAAQKRICGVQETFDIEGVDINTLRAGDKVILKDDTMLEMIVISIRHHLGSPGHMTLEVADKEYVRRNLYARKTF